MISIIIPTYNQRGFLTDAINSALSQSYQDVEVIVVDDNNPDTDARAKTEQLMAVYADNPKVRYLKHEHNKNGSAARNTGFKASKGEFIAFLDDDDYWNPEKLERQLAYLQTHPQYDAVYTYIIVNGAQNPNNCYEGNIVVEYLTNKVSLQTSCLLFTRKAVETINGFDESFKRHQDYEFLIRYFFAGFRMGCLPEYLSYMNSVGGNRLSGTQLNELKARFLQIFDSQLNYLEKQKKGTKKTIIVANYVKNFESHVASKNYKLAWGIFKNYFPMAPFVFISQCAMLLKNSIKRKLSKRRNIN